MRLIYVHGFAGLSGPMLLAALIDAGATLSAVRAAWQGLQLPAAQVTLERVQLADYTATRLVVTPPHEVLSLCRYSGAALDTLVDQAMPSPRAARRLLRLLAHFADTVARVHGSRERDLAVASACMPMVLYTGSGVVAALESLDIDQILSAPVNLGATLRPLTMALMRGASVYGEGAAGELTTVDGAAILTGLAAGFGPLPDMRMSAVGYGASSATTGDDVRGLQVLLGEVEAQPTAERIVVLEANIDDMNPEFYEAIFERLLSQGALDVTLTPLLMKKGRPANTLTVLAPRPAVARLSRVILTETSTFGVRGYEVWRQKLGRFARQVETVYGMIPVKCGVLDGRIVQAAPEYAACKRAALERGVPIRLVYTEAARLAASWLGASEAPEA